MVVRADEMLKHVGRGVNSRYQEAQDSKARVEDLRRPSETSPRQ